MFKILKEKIFTFSLTLKKQILMFSRTFVMCRGDVCCVGAIVLTTKSHLVSMLKSFPYLLHTQLNNMHKCSCI